MGSRELRVSQQMSVKGQGGLNESCRAGPFYLTKVLLFYIDPRVLLGCGEHLSYGCSLAFCFCPRDDAWMSSLGPTHRSNCKQ